jgi:hypothetical protein
LVEGVSQENAFPIADTSHSLKSFIKAGSRPFSPQISISAREGLRSSTIGRIALSASARPPTALCLKRFHGIVDRLLDEIEAPAGDKDASKR